MKFLKKREGLGNPEYALILTFLVLFSIGAMSVMGTRMNTIFTRILSALSGSAGSGTGSSAGSGSTGSGTGSNAGSGSGSGSNSGSGSGNGNMGPAQLLWSPTSLSGFDSTSQNPSSPQTITVQNVGGTAGTPGSVTIGGTDASRFEIVSNSCTGPLAPNASCSVVIRANAGGTGSYTAILNAPGISGQMVLSGSGGSGQSAGCMRWYGNPDLTILAVAPYASNPSVRDQPLQIQNECESPVSNVTPTVVQNGVTPYGSTSITSNTCSPNTTLQQWQSCYVNTRVSATRNDDYSATLFAVTQPTNQHGIALDARVSGHLAPQWQQDIVFNLPAGTVGTSYNNIANWTYFDVNNDLPPSAQQLVSGSLPPGLSFVTPGSAPNEQSSGLQGTPTTAGIYTFTLRIPDGSGQQLDGTFTMSVNGNFSMAFFGHFTIQLNQWFTSQEMDLQIQNQGSGTSPGIVPTLTGDSRFTIVSTNCSGPLAASASCNARVRMTYNPGMANGPVTATLGAAGFTQTLNGVQN